jgi:hypothetical protein
MLWHAVDVETFVTYYGLDAHTILCPLLEDAVTEESIFVALSDCRVTHTDV